MTPTVFIDGDQGTTGLRISQRLQARRDIRLRTLPEARRKSPQHRAEALNACDIAILCLPDAAARESVAWIENPAVRVIDASSAHRVDAAWTYGLPELTLGQAARIADAQRVSNPGCYPSAALALLRPLREAGLLGADAPIAIHATSGYSGRGRAGIEAYENATGAGDAAAPPWQLYGLNLDHKHLPEIRTHGLLSHAPVFVPAYGAYAQGIALTIPLHRRLMPEVATPQRAHAALAEHHAGHPRVQVLPLQASSALSGIDPRELNGSDDLRVMLFADPRGESLLLAAVLDNLGKGAAGAALQNLDLLLAGG